MLSRVMFTTEQTATTTLCSACEFNLQHLKEDLKDITGEEVSLDEILVNHEMITDTRYPACPISNK